VVVDDMTALQAGQVYKDVTSNLLLVVAELVQLALLRRLELRVEHPFLLQRGMAVMGVVAVLLAGVRTV
jgi:hypothetical protein